jgi:hypothetical protein
MPLALSGLPRPIGNIEVHLARRGRVAAVRPIERGGLSILKFVFGPEGDRRPDSILALLARSLCGR